MGLSCVSVFCCFAFRPLSCMSSIPYCFPILHSFQTSINFYTALVLMNSRLKKRLSGSTMDTWEKETKTLFGYRLPKVMRKFLYTVRCTALAVGCFFLGFVGGLVGMNTGTAICILFNMLLHFRPLKAIGTALFVQVLRKSCIKMLIANQFEHRLLEPIQPEYTKKT